MVGVYGTYPLYPLTHQPYHIINVLYQNISMGTHGCFSAIKPFMIEFTNIYAKPGSGNPGLIHRLEK